MVKKTPQVHAGGCSKLRYVVIGCISEDCKTPATQYCRVQWHLQAMAYCSPCRLI
jgi:hypothetical protein